MLSLATIARGEGEPATVRFRGRDLPCRLLSAAETDLIGNLYARPVPPKKPPAGRGALGPWEPDETDPAYLSRRADWIRKQQALTVAAALGWATADGATWSPGGGVDGNREYAAAVAAEIVGEVTHSELLALYNRVIEVERRAAGLGEDPEGKAGWGASSPPQSGPSGTGGDSPTSTA